MQFARVDTFFCFLKLKNEAYNLDFEHIAVFPFLPRFYQKDARNANVSTY
jgi:hypothetical protein